MSIDGGSAIAPKCFATLIFQDANLTWMRRAWEEDEEMVQLWASRMLKLTEIPIFVMHAYVDAPALLANVDPARRLKYWPVSLVHGAYWGKNPHYRFMHTKFQAWNLPCREVAFADYDSIPLRPMDSVFDFCDAGAALCAVRDQVTPKKKTLHLPNAGMMVIRTNTTTYRRLIDIAEEEAKASKKRVLAEQGFLLEYFPHWVELPRGFNLPEWSEVHKGFKELIASNESYLYHRKIAMMSKDVAKVVGVVAEWAAIRRRKLSCRSYNVSGLLYRLCGQVNSSWAAELTHLGERKLKHDQRVAATSMPNVSKKTIQWITLSRCRLCPEPGVFDHAVHMAEPEMSEVDG